MVRRLDEFLFSAGPFPECPHCQDGTRLEQHRRKPDLLVCPHCWYKYRKAEAMQGSFIRVKAKKKARYGKQRRRYK